MHGGTKGRGRGADQHEGREPIDDLENAGDQHRDEDAVDALMLQPAPGTDKQAADHASNAAGHAK